MIKETEASKKQNYKRIRKLGQGSFGEVLLVERLADKSLIALKKITLTSSTTLHSVFNECNVMNLLDHPNIIKCHECFRELNQFCIALEYADDGDLLGRVRATKSRNSLIPEEEIISWFTQILLAVEYLHKNHIIHRDIKLQNIFLMKSGLIKLGDFGISKKLETNDELAKTSLGTPYYLSPEICLGKRYNHKSDVWMLGCVLFELCTLEKPFSGESLHTIINKIVNEPPESTLYNSSFWVGELVNEMLAKDPSERPNVTAILERKVFKDEMEKLKVQFPVYRDYLEKNEDLKEKSFNYMSQNKSGSDYSTLSISFQEYLRRKSVPWETNSGVNSPMKGQHQESSLARKSPFSNFNFVSTGSGTKLQKKVSSEDNNSVNSEAQTAAISPFKVIRIEEEKDQRELFSEDKNLKDSIEKAKSSSEMLSNGTPTDVVTSEKGERKSIHFLEYMQNWRQSQCDTPQVMQADGQESKETSEKPKEFHEPEDDSLRKSLKQELNRLSKNESEKKTDVEESEKSRVWSPAHSSSQMKTEERVLRKNSSHPDLKEDIFLKKCSDEVYKKIIDKQDPAEVKSASGESHSQINQKQNRLQKLIDKTNSTEKRRKYLFKEFLESKLGAENYRKVMNILEENNYTVNKDLPESERLKIFDIIGRDNLHCLVILKYLAENIKG